MSWACLWFISQCLISQSKSLKMQTRISVYKLYTKSKALYIQVYQAAVSPLLRVKPPRYSWFTSAEQHSRIWGLTASSLRHLSFYMDTESQMHLHAHLHKHYIQSHTAWHSDNKRPIIIIFFISRVHERWIQCMGEVLKTQRQLVWTKARRFYLPAHRLDLPLSTDTVEK